MAINAKQEVVAISEVYHIILLDEFMSFALSFFLSIYTFLAESKTHTMWTWKVAWG